MDTDSKSQDSSFVASPIVDDDDNSILNANECNKAINNDEATASNEPKEEPPSSALGAGSPDNKSQDSGATSPKSHELKNSSDPESSSNSSPMAALDDTADGVKAGERGDDDDGTNAKHMDIPKMESPTVSQESNSNEITNSGQDLDQGQSPGPNQRDEEDSTVAEAATKSQIHSQAAIPENILSPPKSETQTDETNTATSSSPASDSQLSPLADVVSNPMASAEAEATSAPVTPTTPETEKLPANAADERISQPINIVANGIIPNSGKPLMSSMNKKLNKSSSRSTRQRKAKPLVAMYESEISDNKVGIKLCIKKSDTTSSAATTADPVVPAPVATPSKAAPSKASAKKRSRKAKSSQRMDSDDSEYETKRKKSTSSNNNSEQKQKKVAFAAGVGGDKDTRIREPVEQGDWGAKIPEEILCKIFRYVVDKEGCLPTLFRIGRVCTLWRQVSLSSELWKSLDLTTWIKDKHRTELKLKWFIDNRCRSCTDLNVSNWKITDINCFLNKLSIGCPNLSSITLSGWKGFTSDHLTFLVTNMKKLKRIDLSSINVEMNASKSAVGLQSLCNALQTMKDRLTHLYLAHNRLAGIPQIVNILSKHCPNLVLLDLSNVHTQATSHGILHIEKLQHGCQKLRVLRVTNSHVTLGPASMQEMMNSPGFPDLEELSVAALTDESRVMGDEHLQRILKTSSKLKLLDVRNCTRLTHESLIRLPAWDIKHLFLSGCSVTRDVGSGLELIASKWAHSLIELDLAWANVQHALDNALRALAEKGSESPLAHLNLCGSSVSEEAVKEILANCAHMSSINLASCRGLPRGVKRLMQGPTELQELRDVLKVQMKVKLPSQIKREQEEAAAAAAADEKMDVDRGGEGDGSGGGGGCGIESNNSN